MDRETRIAKTLELRERWVDLSDGLRVRVRRPPEAHLFKFRSGAGLEEFLRCAVGWEGFTEATFLGSAVGSDSSVPFHMDDWLTLAMDNLVWAGKVAEAVSDAIKEHLEKKEAVAGN